VAVVKNIAGVQIPLVDNHRDWQRWLSMKLASVAFALQGMMQFYNQLDDSARAYLPSWTMTALLTLAMIATGLQQPARVIAQKPTDGN
jgi:hypothetical protein